MKVLPHFLLLFALCSATFIQSAREHPLLAVVIMVKNEAPFMEKTLQPYVDAGIGSYVVFDTGSTDDTISVTRKFFDRHKIKQAYIFQEPFVNFAVSRNRALVLAEQKFPNAAFFLMPDAEWYLANAKGLIDFCKQEVKKNGPDAPHSYLIKIFNNSLDFYQHRLLRRSAGLRFIGVVHETIGKGTPHKVPTHIHFKLGGSRQGQAKSKQRWYRDKELLLKEHQRNPKDPRTTFYLAQTLDCLGQLEEAFTYYKLRTEQGGWKEEQALAYYRLGKATNALMKQGKQGYTWEMAFNAFMKSYALRSCRAEPLIEIGRHFVNLKEHVLAYLFLRRAVELYYPDHEILFVEKQLYDYDRYDLLGQCAWQNNAIDLGEWAVKRALAFAPHMPHLHHNLKCYAEAKQAKAQAS